MAETWILGWKCERCSHEWPKKKDSSSPTGYKDTPILCPKCRSPYWQRPKTDNNPVVQTDVTQTSTPTSEQQTDSPTVEQA